jgi:predicted negative regulator of RcsB-dependent stress response
MKKDNIVALVIVVIVILLGIFIWKNRGAEIQKQAEKVVEPAIEELSIDAAETEAVSAAALEADLGASELDLNSEFTEIDSALDSI